MTDPAIVVDNLSKRFRLHTQKRTSLKERMIRGSGRHEDFWALRDVSFDVAQGSTFGLIGHNGSGKSTLLKTLAGIYRPTSGSISADGRISALLELGAGFHSELSGRENIYLNGAILGLPRKQIESSIDEIIDFAGIGEFIDAPVKVYSSGMYVRLGFSIAVTLDPEILIVDEIIAVGDEEFQRKCFDHLFDLRKRGTTIVLVSHALGLVQDLCDGAVWLDHGRVRSSGKTSHVIDDYLADINAREASAEEPEADVASPNRHGSGEVRITSIEFLDAAGRPAAFLEASEACALRLHYTATDPVARAVFGLGFVHESGATVAGPNSGQSPFSLAKGDGIVEYRLDRLSLQPGVFRVSAAVVDRGHTYDYVDRAYELRVRANRATEEPGLTRFYGVWSHTGVSVSHEESRVIA